MRLTVRMTSEEFEVNSKEFMTDKMVNVYLTKKDYLTKKVERFIRAYIKDNTLAPNESIITYDSKDEKLVSFKLYEFKSELIKTIAFKCYGISKYLGLMKWIFLNY